jgi:hypothetical protein
MGACGEGEGGGTSNTWRRDRVIRDVFASFCEDGTNFCVKIMYYCVNTIYIFVNLCLVL